MAELTKVLEGAVARVIAVVPVAGEIDLIDIGARAICGLYNRPGCLCGTAQWKICHAKLLYRDQVTAVVNAFKVAGVIPKKLRKSAS